MLPETFYYECCVSNAVIFAFDVLSTKSIVHVGPACFKYGVILCKTSLEVVNAVNILMKKKIT